MEDASTYKLIELVGTSPKQREFKAEEPTRFRAVPEAEREPHFHLSEHQSIEEFKEHIREKTRPEITSEDNE